MKVIWLVLTTHVNSGGVVTQVGPFADFAQCQAAWQVVAKQEIYLSSLRGACVEGVR